MQAVIGELTKKSYLGRVLDSGGPTWCLSVVFESELETIMHKIKRQPA